jgi:hypothetical protein
MVFNVKNVVDPYNKKRKKRKPDDIVQLSVPMFQYEMDIFDQAIEILKKKRVSATKKTIVPGLVLKWAREIINNEKGEQEMQDRLRLIVNNHEIINNDPEELESTKIITRIIKSLSPEVERQKPPVQLTRIV